MPHSSARLPSQPTERHTLRIFEHDDRTKWTLRQFFEFWFRPEILERERRSTKGTIDFYVEAVRWWDKLTNNPSLQAIDREALKSFRDKLREATYQRSPRKGAKKYPLSQARQIGLLSAIRTIVYHFGPELDNKRETAQILDSAPHIAIEKYEGEPKPSFTLQQARRIAAATDQMRAPKIAGVPAPAWCYALLCAFVFTGLRRGTIRRLRWSMVQIRDKRPWLIVPSRDVSKTRKATRVLIHRELWQALQAIKTDSDFVFSIDRYQSRPRVKGGKRPMLSGDALHRLMRQMQEAAGIPPEQRLTPHAWRRTHVDWLINVGYGAARSIGQAAADHGDARTTEGFYVDIKNKCRRKLPWLRPERKPAKGAPLHDQQRRLFD